MKKISTAYCILFFVSILPAFSQSSGIAIEHANVIPLNENKVLADHTVLVENGKITAIGKNIKVPKGYQKIDGTGKYIVPGFADMHAHLPGFQSQPYSSERYLLLNLLKGVTTLRGMRGHPSQLEMRRNTLALGKPTPSLYISTPPITKQDKSLTPENAEALFTDYFKQGYDFIKVLSVDTTLYDQLMPIFTKNQWHVTGHSPDGKMARAISKGQKGIEHIEPFVNSYLRDSVATLKLFSDMKQLGVSNCPDVYWYYIFGYQYSLETLQHIPGINYVTADMKQAWTDKWQQKLNALSNPDEQRKSNAARIDTYLKLLPKMNAAGVLLLISPGDGEFIVPGYGFHEEMKIFAHAGIQPYDILKAATVNAAASMGQTKKWGTIEVGKDADVVLLSRNPLTNIENADSIEGVMVKGKWITRAEIEKQLAAAP